MKKMIKKYWKQIVIVLVALGALVALGLFLKKHNKDQSSLTGFTSPDGSFSTSLPKSWDAQVPEKGAIVATFKTDSIQSTSNVQPYINIAKGEQGGDIEMVFNDTMKKYKDLFRKINIVQQGDFMLDGNPAKKVVFDGNLWGRLMRYAIVIGLRDYQAYVITAASSPSDFADVDKVIADMVSNWEFLDQKAQ